MIPYFKKLFAYDKHTNDVMIDTIVSAGVSAGKPLDLLAHTFNAQQIWLQRCKRLPAYNGPLWPTGQAENLKAINAQNHADWIAYLDSASERDIQESITYTNSRGETYTDTLEDIIAHVINHGTHHRAQVGQLLKAAGVEQLPVCDYIMYIREL